MDVTSCPAIQRIHPALEQAGEHVLPSSCNSSTSQLFPCGFLEATDQMPVSGGHLKDTHGTLHRHTVLSTWTRRSQDEGDKSGQEPGKQQSLQHPSWTSPFHSNKLGLLAASPPFPPSMQGLKLKQILRLRGS